MTIGNNDVRLTTTQGRFLTSEVLIFKDVEFSLSVDNIAQESNETFAIVLQLRSTDQLFGDSNVTIRNRLEGVIIDSDGRLTEQ